MSTRDDFLEVTGSQVLYSCRNVTGTSEQEFKTVLDAVKAIPETVGPYTLQAVFVCLAHSLKKQNYKENKWPSEA